MKGLLIVFASLLVAPSPKPPELPPKSIPLKPTAATAALDKAIEKLSLPCPDRVHINDTVSREEGARFKYRPYDLYDDCNDEMDALVRTREPIDKHLLELGNKGKKLPERYRAAWILIQRRNRKVVPILKKMAKSSSAEERYLTWHLYTAAIRERQLAVPLSFKATLARCRKEQNRYVRAGIMDFLGACKAKEAVPLLTARLNEDSGNSAVYALGEIRDPKTVPAIIARANKETWNRLVYFCVLGRIGTPEAVDYLLEHLDKGCFVAKALFESRSPKALPALEQYLDRLKKIKGRSDLDLAVTQICLLRLKFKDPREQLIRLAEDRKQSEWMRWDALEALENYDKKPFAGRILKVYRTETDDTMRMICIHLLQDLPGTDITEAMIHQALTDDKDKYYHSHDDLVRALNQRLNTSFRTLTALVEYLRRQLAAKEK
jgi:HEAT repeat protein